VTVELLGGNAAVLADNLFSAVIVESLFTGRPGGACTTRTTFRGATPLG
jgi:hypothetical protein